MNSTVETRVDEVGVEQPSQEDYPARRPPALVDESGPDEGVILLVLRPRQTRNGDDDEAGE